VAVFCDIDSVRVEVPDPGAARDAGLNAAVAPAGSPEALRARAELKPPETAVVIVLVPLTPLAVRVTETDAGEAEIVNAGAVTVSVTVAVCVSEPAAPVTVMV
jgi:hypothetical protein